MCPLVHINNAQLPHIEEVKYLVLHFDRRLTWHKHIFIKRKQQPSPKCTGYLEFVIFYKQQTCDLHNCTQTNLDLWNTTLGTTSTSNIEILECYQLKVLCMITDTPGYVLNTVMWKDLQIPTFKHKISQYSYHYSKRVSMHPNELILNLQESPATR
jgi:hypothetical protein